MTGSKRCCRACGSTRIGHRFIVRGQEILRCADCEFQQVADPPSSQELDEIYSEGYFASAKYKGNKNALEKEEQRRLKLLRRFLPTQADVLDAGCSTGEFIACAKKYYNMHGVDYSSFAINIARQQNPELTEQLQAGQLENSPMRHSQFEGICLWDVIEHIWDPVVVLRDLMGRIKPGGVLAISTPAIDALTARVMGPSWAFMTPPEHLSFWSRQAFEHVFQQIGNCDIVHYSRQGKWANLEFISYKAGRVAPLWFPRILLKPFKHWPLKKMSIYVPTRDIQYLVIRKRV